MRILFDTNILVRAAKPGAGPAREAVLLAVTSGHTLIVPEFVLAELRRALTYPRLRARYALQDEEIESYAVELQRVSVSVDPAGVKLAEAVVCRDPDDEPVILSAIAGRADVLCTLDRDIRERRFLPSARGRACKFSRMLSFSACCERSMWRTSNVSAGKNEASGVPSFWPHTWNP